MYHVLIQYSYFAADNNHLSSKVEKLVHVRQAYSADSVNFHTSEQSLCHTTSNLSYYEQPLCSTRSSQVLLVHRSALQLSALLLCYQMLL